MNGRCCCGCCSLQRGTAVALVIAGIQAVISLIANIELALLLSDEDSYNPFAEVINVDTIEDFDVLHGIVLGSIGLNAFWLLFGIFAARGNVTLSHGRLAPWVLLTYLVTFFNMGAGIYTAIKFQESLSETKEFFKVDEPTKTLTYLTLLCVYSGGGLMVFLNLYLAYVVEARGKEIDQDYSALAFYIMSHMRRCTHMAADRQNLLPEAPPSYDNVPHSAENTRCSDSSESGWSLSNEAVKAINTGHLNDSFEGPVICPTELGRLVNETSSNCNPPLSITSVPCSTLRY